MVPGYLLLMMQFPCGQVLAGDGATPQLATACSGEQKSSPTHYEFPFLDRVGDARFSPRSLMPSTRIKTIIQPKLGGLPISAAALDDDTLLLVNYHDIRSLNIRSGEVAELDVDLSRLGAIRFIPTGIAVGRRSGLIYLANYLGNDILIGRLRANKLTFETEIKGDGVISPENVALSSDEGWLVSANYDGNTATAFEASGDRYIQKWKTSVPLAHGIAVLGSHVFVSSLLLRQILVLNLEDGSVVESFGQPGWDTYCLNFLWPTSIEIVNEQIMAITDAHTGGIYRIDFEHGNRSLIDVIGGTTSGLMGLQMPYAAASIGGNLAILSTFSPKIVIAGPATAAGSPEVEIVIVEHPEQAENDARNSIAAPLGVGWNGYVHLASSHFKISGIEMVPSYGSLVSVTRDRPTDIDQNYNLNPDTLPLFGGSMYFIEAHVLDNSVILSSPSVPFGFYVTLGNTSCVAKVDFPDAPLATDNGLRHRFGTTRYEDVERRALIRLHELDLHRQAGGFVGLSDIASSFGITLEAARGAVRNTEVGEAIETLGKCGEQKSMSPACDAVLRRINENRMSYHGLSFFELLFLDMSSHRCIIQ
jgi:hypothetical protein